MKKILTLLTIISFSCKKDIPVTATIDSMCWDNTNYHVDITLKTVAAGDKPIAAFIFGKDTLSTSLLLMGPGKYTVLLGTGEVGCGGVIAVKNGNYVVSQSANCVNCK